jgi:hypothetical protein
LFALTGCQALTPNWSQAKNWLSLNSLNVSQSKFGTPVKMAVIWSPAVYNEPGKTPTRGFGGRIYFYDINNRPIPVEGQLVVYAYNDSLPTTDGKSADRKFAFTPEQFTTHYNPTELGAAYSVWIPWDEAGKPQVELSLVPVFTASSGQLVIGQLSSNLLPGPTTPEQQSRISRFTLPPPLMNRVGPDGQLIRDPGVQAAAYQEPPTDAALGAPQFGQPQAPRGLDTLSITLPGTLSERLAQPQAPVSLGQQWVQQRAERLKDAAAAMNRGQMQAGPATASAAVPQAPVAASQRSTRYEPVRPQAPNTRAFPPTAGQSLKAPFHAEPPSALPGSPQSGLNLTDPASWPVAPRTQS